MIQKKSLTFFEKNIGYKFKDEKIIKQSLTHPSYYKEKLISNKDLNQFERLEFLGDRVLGLVVATLLFNNNKKNDEGDLSKKYSYLVQKKFLYKISIDLSINEILLYNFKKNNKKMLVSIFSDAVESLIGGIYLDGGYSSAYNFINKFWLPYLDIKVSKTQDPKTILQELSQQRSKQLPEYKLIIKKGPPHSPIFTVSLDVLNLKKIKADGTSIREAEKKAADLALKLLDEKKTS